MNPVQERRSHPTDTTPRATYAQCTIAGHCQFVMENSMAHAYLLSQGFTELTRTDDDARQVGVLMLEPEGWGE